LKATETSLPGVLILQPAVFSDDRGFFMETYHAARFRDLGIDAEFVQDNHSRSTAGVVRGLHYQEPNAQGKLVRCTRGAVFDVAVDIRAGSPTFGKWVGVELSEENRSILWIPGGYAHGFCTLTDVADLVYKCTVVYCRENDCNIVWNDPDIGIAWPHIDNPRLSEKDAKAPRLKDATLLPKYS
jgi:dTDP-4-dehydrorhamnose 3,5-epimerase